MNIWFLIWVFLSLFIFGVFGWSMLILLRQKISWQNFAKKYGLELRSTRMFRSPVITGQFKDIPFTIYSEEQIINQAGSKRFRTIIQFQLNLSFRTSGIVAGADAEAFARGLNLKESYMPDYPSWNKSIFIFTDAVDEIKDFFSEERCKSLNALMTIKTIATILIFDETTTYLRFETPDPFDDANKLERFMLKAVEHAKILTQ